MRYRGIDKKDYRLFLRCAPIGAHACQPTLASDRAEKYLIRLREISYGLLISKSVKNHYKCANRLFAARVGAASRGWFWFFLLWLAHFFGFLLLTFCHDISPFAVSQGAFALNI
jgi:hypothetical protein